MMASGLLTPVIIRLIQTPQGRDAVAAWEEFGVVLFGLGVVEVDGAGAILDVDAVDAVCWGFHGPGKEGEVDDVLAIHLVDDEAGQALITDGAGAVSTASERTVSGKRS